jgi:hypothetical protein
MCSFIPVDHNMYISIPTGGVFRYYIQTVMLYIDGVIHEIL